MLHDGYSLQRILLFVSHFIVGFYLVCCGFLMSLKTTGWLLFFCFFILVVFNIGDPGNNIETLQDETDFSILVKWLTILKVLFYRV